MGHEPSFKQRIISLHERNMGLTADEISEIIGVSRAYVVDTMAEYCEETGKTNPFKVRRRGYFLEQIRILAPQGKTASEIAKVLGTSPESIRGLASSHDIKLKRGQPGWKTGKRRDYRRPSLLLPRLKALPTQDMTAREIALALNVSIHTIRDALGKYSLPFKRHLCKGSGG